MDILGTFILKIVTKDMLCVRIVGADTYDIS